MSSRLAIAGVILTLGWYQLFKGAYVLHRPWRWTTAKVSRHYERSIDQ